MQRVVVTLTVFLAAAPPAFADVQIKDVKPRHGVLGPPRKSLDVFPGDDLFFGFTVTGAATDAKGAVNVSETVELFDANGKQMLSRVAPTKGVLALGGDVFPGFAQLNFGTDFPPGEYKVRVTVKDLIQDATASFERKVTVKAADFAFVKLRFAYDKQGDTPAPVGGVVSQRLFYTVKVLGFDKSRQKFKVTMKAEILDDKGKAVMRQPLTTTAASDDAKVAAATTDLNFNANFSLNRAGAFTLRLTFTDEIAQKSVSLSAPLQVTAP